MKKPIALVEAHDSRLEAIAVRPSGVVILILGRLGVYRSSAPDRYDIWSHRAELQLDGVGRLEVNGAIPDDGWIIDHAIDGGTTQSAAELLDYVGRSLPIREFSLTFRDGTRVVISAQAMMIRLKDDGHVVDSFEGPL